METKKTTMRGASIDVFYTGSYYFYSDFYGLLAIATRLGYGDDQNKFTITVGNRRCVGGRLNDDAVVSSVKRFVRKIESEHNIRDLEFSTENEDLSDKRLTVSIL